MKTKLFACAVAFFLLPVLSFGEGDKQWLLVSGSWSVDTSNQILVDQRSRAKVSGYNEVYDMNSVSSIELLDKVTKIQADIELSSPMQGNKAMLFFASQTQRSFYAVRLNGSMSAITSLSLIHSSVKDSTLPVTAKDNFLVQELSSIPVSLKWGDPISLIIEVKKKKLSILANGIKLDYQLDQPLSAGKLGFSHADTIMKVKSIQVFSGDTILLKDDFTKDRIKRYSVEMKNVK